MKSDAFGGLTIVTIGALIVRIGLWGILYYNYSKEPPAIAFGGLTIANLAAGGAAVRLQLLLLRLVVRTHELFALVPKPQEPRHPTPGTHRGSTLHAKHGTPSQQRHKPYIWRGILNIRGTAGITSLFLLRFSPLLP